MSASVSPRPVTAATSLRRDASAPKPASRGRQRPQSAADTQVAPDEPEHPALREYREMEAAIKAHNEAMVRQAKIVENALFAAEVAASNTSTTLYSNELTTKDPNGLLRQEVFESVKFGPRLRAALASERVIECRRILLNSEDSDSPESIENAVTGLFSSPVEALEVMSRNSERMICDAYALMVDLCSELQPKKTYILQPYAASLRRILATQMLSTKSALTYCSEIRNEMERLEGFLESTAKRKDEACRAAHELLQEAQSLRSQIFKSIADVQPVVPDTINPVLTGQEATRAIVMLQIENTHHLRVSRPKLISEALLQAKIVIEGAIIEHGGRRTNYNSATEAKEVFDREKNVMMPPQNYMMDFETVTDAAECCAAIQIGLLNSIHWSHHLLALPEFAEVRADQSDNAPLVWGGLRARIGLHVGALRTAYPFAASNGSAENCPFLSGMAADRLMQILRIICGGEVLMSDHAADAFQKRRFEDPRCCPTLQLTPHGHGTGHSKPLQRLTTEKLLLREKAAFEPRAAESCVFPSVSFWRNSVDGEDLSQLEFGMEGEVEIRRNFTSKEYEDRIESLSATVAQLTDKIKELEAATATCQAELQANLDASRQAFVDSERAAAANVKLSRRIQRLAWKLRSAEECCMDSHDVIARAGAHSAVESKELLDLRKAEATRKRRLFVDASCQTLEETPKSAPVPPPPPPTVEKPDEPCPECTLSKLSLTAVHSTLRTLSSLVDEVRLGGWSVGELMPIFSKRTRCVVKDVTKKAIPDGGTQASSDAIVDSVFAHAVGIANKLTEILVQRTAENEATKADSANALEAHDSQVRAELTQLRNGVKEQKQASDVAKRRFGAVSSCFSELIRLFSNFRKEIEEVAEIDQLISGIGALVPYYTSMCSELEVDFKRVEMEPPEAFDDISSLLIARARRRMIAQEAHPSDFDDSVIAVKQTIGNVRKALVRSGEMSPRLMSMRMSPTRSNLSPRLGQPVLTSSSANILSNSRGVVFTDAPMSPRDEPSPMLEHIRPVESSTFEPVDPGVDVAAIRRELDAEYAQRLESARTAQEEAEQERAALQQQLEDLLVRPRTPRPATSDAAVSTIEPNSSCVGSTQTEPPLLRSCESQTAVRESTATASQTAAKPTKDPPAKVAVGTMTDGSLLPLSEGKAQARQTHTPRVGSVSPSSSAINVPTGPRYLSTGPPVYEQRVVTPDRIMLEQQVDFSNGSAVRLGRESSMADRHSSSGAVGRLQRVVDQARLPASLPSPTGNRSEAVDLVTSFRQPEVVSVEMGGFGVREIIDDGAIYLPLKEGSLPSGTTAHPQTHSRPGTASRSDGATLPATNRVSSAHNKEVPRNSKFVVVRRANLGVGLGFD